MYGMKTTVFENVVLCCCHNSFVLRAVFLQCGVTLCYVTLRYIILFYFILCYFILFYFNLFYFILYSLLFYYLCLFPVVCNVFLTIILLHICKVLVCQEYAHEQPITLYCWLRTPVSCFRRCVICGECAICLQST